MVDDHAPSARTKRTRGQGRTADFPRLLGGRLCLHFANTIEGPISDDPVEFLNGYADLVRWSWHAAVFDEEAAGRLLTTPAAQLDEASRVFTRATVLRRAVDGVFRRIGRGDPPDEKDLARIQREYVAALTHAQLVRHGPDGHARTAGGKAPASADTQYALSWDESDALSRPLWAIAVSAMELLTNADLRRIKECPGAGDCGWLFYDSSPSGRRRWCSMEGCGSRVKMRRHYARHHPRAVPNIVGPGP